MTCLAARVEDRYPSAGDLVRALAEYKGRVPRTSELEDIMARIRAREQKTASLCWNCRRPLPLKTSHCPHCGEAI